MWIETAISAASALCGGFIGGWVVAFRLGRWRQHVEDRLDGIEARLARGDCAVSGLPVLTARVDLILEELRGLKAEARQDRQAFVSHEECDRRHGNG
ncbi:MAG: hypothetical protein GXY85_03250 [Candidatus Brocadiaceae bacterium]|nr:hypothetical protein [Candidatus Brocadiaceae bacterium]